jgi:hypothetical protein
LSIVRLIGNRIAREQFEALRAPTTTGPLPLTDQRIRPTRNRKIGDTSHDPRCAQCSLFV